MLETDRKRLYQAVLNVVSNALKYTEQGKVNVTTSIKKDQLQIRVVDTGIGIAEADLPNLFKPFERAESRLKIKTLGTGLGLYLTRKILMQLLGGDIHVKSELEVGSAFTIQIPIKLPQMVEQATPSILEDNSL
jgi:signal transduction histidine kinase